MAGLLSDTDILEIRDAIKQTTDTFLRLPIIYHLREKNFDRLNPDLALSKTDFELSALQVYDKTSDTALVDKKTQGKIDLSEGYLLFNFEDLDTAGLIDSEGRFKGKATQDEFTAQGTLFEISGADALGQLDEKFSLLKLWFKRKMK